jgi:regulator of nonsense transcripts 1
VGDHKQLPPSVGFWAKNAGYDESLFQRLSHRVKPMLLDTQYRSHPLIMDFPSLKFYENGLKNGTPKHHRKAPAGFNWNTDKNGESLPVAFVNSFHREDRECGLSKSNTGEAKIIIDILVGFFKKGVKPNEIGIISPYAGQNKTIKKLLQKLNLDVELNSVDAFQGREKEIILFSATRSNLQGGIGFLSDPRRFNVMHTRAKKGLVVVGNRETLERDKTWKHWLEWIDENRLEVKVKH